MKRKRVQPKLPSEVQTRRELNYLKPTKFSHYFTLIEVSQIVAKDPSWLKRLERDGRIPLAARVQHGELSVRLWSPEQVTEIQTVLAAMKPGRPPSS